MAGAPPDGNGKNRVSASKVRSSPLPFSGVSVSRGNIQKVMHTFHRLFHRLVFTKFFHNFRLSPVFPLFPHFSPDSFHFRRIFMQKISYIRNKMQKRRRGSPRLRFCVTVFHPKWISWRRRSAPFRRCSPPGTRSTPGNRSWRHCRRTGTGAADRPSPRGAPPLPGYPGG